MGKATETGTTTATLTDFLLARIAEDQAVADMGLRMSVPSPYSSLYSGSGHHPVMAASRLLAECEAKRRIVAEHHRMNPGDCAVCEWRYGAPGTNGQVAYPCPTLRALALPYSDHPDYRDEWRT